ncbi:MAG: hypothetical protein KC561_00230 [Myxococcales bacterium]|nr:hypothetical protein [Myxococcales bacterium]
MDRASSIRSTAAALSLVITLLWAQAAISQEEGSSIPVGTDGRTVNPVFPTYPDHALFSEPGRLQSELAYSASFFEDPVPTVHSVFLNNMLTVAELVEVRVNWRMLRAAGGDTSIGDLGLGVKGGFLGGIGENIHLAGVFELLLPTGDGPFSLGDGIGALASFVASTFVSTLRIDIQAGVDTHIFSDNSSIDVPLAADLVWNPIDQLSVYGDFVLTLDLTNFSDSTTSLGAGAGYRFLPFMSVDATARLGLSQGLPDAEVGVSVSFLSPRFW